jgi:uncharacterized membrane protein YraQ (UPF0718 family)
MILDLRTRRERRRVHLLWRLTLWSMALASAVLLMLLGIYLSFASNTAEQIRLATELLALAFSAGWATVFLGRWWQR